MSHNHQQQQFNSWNNQQQPVFQNFQNTNQPLNNNSDFPGLNDQNSAQQSNPFASMNLKDVNVKAAEFVPQGVVAGNDFEDSFASLDKQPSKKKKQQPTKAQIEKEKQEALMALPTKGKPAEFFAHNGVLSQPQMVFVFEFYPQYSMNPTDIINWLYMEAQRYEFEEAQKKQQDAHAYSKPGHAGRRNNNQQQDYDDEEEEEVGIGGQISAKQQKKKQQQKTSQQDPGKKKQKEQDNAEKVAKQEVAVKTKYVKDITVKVDEEQINAVDETRQPCSLVFIGHVDAGKSTISGQIMLKMGCVDDRTIEKYKKDAKDKGRDSWWLAYCMDIGEEEQAKGKTVEVGRATFNTKQKQFTVFDAPGHKNYVPNMMVGAALADYAGLVISARKGEFEAGFEKDGQTREHVQLAKSLGVQKLVVVVNKMDEQSVQWSEDRWKEIRTKLEPFLERSGYPAKDVYYVPISGLTGDNIDFKVDPKVCPWYKGETLMDILDNLPVENRDPNGALRIPILEKVKEQGVVAHGKIESGTIRLGDKIMVSPSGYPAQIGQILDHKNEQVKFARPGENVQITLIHITDEGMIQKGDVISDREKVTPVTMIFEAEMELLELLPQKPILSKGYSCIMHCHTFADDITVEALLDVYEKDNKEERDAKAKFARSLQCCRVRISTKVPLAMEKFDVFPQLGRFTLRDEGRTIAVGQITKYKPHKVTSSIQVAGAPAQQQNQQDKSDKNQALVFDMESGQVAQQKKQLDAIPE